jgi:hypothetical protein
MVQNLGYGFSPCFEFKCSARLFKNNYPIIERQMTPKLKDTEPISKKLNTRSSTEIHKLGS